MVRSFLAVICLVGLGCSAGSQPDAANAKVESTTTTTAATTTTINPRWNMTYKELEKETLTPAELKYQAATKQAYGIGTNPPKMLELGYDLCERFAAGGSRADAIRDWSIEENQPIQRASLLGSAATDYLCPE